MNRYRMLKAGGGHNNLICCKEVFSKLFITPQSYASMCRTARPTCCVHSHRDVLASDASEAASLRSGSLVGVGASAGPGAPAVAGARLEPRPLQEQLGLLVPRTQGKLVADNEEGPADHGTEGRGNPVTEEMRYGGTRPHRHLLR